MLEHLPKKSVIVYLVILSLFGFGQIAHGAELKITKIIDFKDNQIIFSYGGLEKQDNFLCQATNLSCQNLGEKIPAEITNLFDDPTPLSTKIANVKYDRANATRLILSPDEKWLAYYDAALANKEKTRKFVLVALANGQTKKTYETTDKVNYWDLLSEDLRLFHFAPDSSKLVYLDDRSGYPSLYSVDLTGTSPKGGRMPGKQITLKNYTIADFLVWDKDIIYFTANRESDHLWSLYKFDTATRDVKKIASNISYNQRMQRIGTGQNDKLLFLQIKNNSTVPVLYDPTVTISSGKAFSYFPSFPANPPVTGYTESEIKLAKLGGVLLKPNRQVSLGSHSYTGYAIYDWLMGEMAKNGALVLKLDYRGSYGYGRDFAQSITGQVGKGDVTDVVNALAELKKTKKIGPVYLVGNSYGGYLALKAIVENPKTFAGAMPINGVMDWFVLLDKLENSIFNTQFGGLLEEKNSDIYYQADIADRVKNLTNQKIVIVQSSADQTIPPSQADYITKIFSLRNRVAELVKYPGEDHSFKKVSSLEDICRRLTTMAGLSAGCRWSN
ncbi:MAG: prolyl oligopeptidase family serine peptidase [Candidatus Vogelbacteria bacterium]|nr:prolyl oligopeptidase family serine peptidase [Candidatus Vogelbacteria bacterium]